MCGRCRQVFNAFESLKRVEDDYLVPGADEPAQPAGAPTQTMSDEIMAIDEAEDAGFRDEYAAESAVRNSRTDDREREPEENREIDSGEGEPATAGSPSTGFIGFKDVSSGAYLPLQVSAELPAVALHRPTSDSPGDATIAWSIATQGVDNIPDAAENLPGTKSLLEPEPLRSEKRADRNSSFGTTTDTANDAIAEEGDAAQSNAMSNNDPPWLRPKTVKPSRTKLWLLGCLLMLVALAAQLGYIFRVAIIEAAPQTRLYFVDVCGVLGCTITWGRDSNMIKIVESDLIEPSGKPGRILVTATLANRATMKQDLPSLELRLTDAANQVLVSRVLQPSDYLGRAVQREDGIAPGTELLINLNIESSNKPVASGYGLRAFYPQ